MIFLVAIVVIIVTVGIIFITIPNYFENLMSVVDTSSQITNFFMDNFYIFASIAILGAVISLVLLLLDRQKKHTARIVVSSVVIALSIVSIIVMALGVGK